MEEPETDAGLTISPVSALRLAASIDHLLLRRSPQGTSGLGVT